MSISDKIKTTNKKSSKTKFNTSKLDKLLRFQLYHQDKLVNMNFYPANMFHQKRSF